MPIAAGMRRGAGLSDYDLGAGIDGCQIMDRGGKDQAL